MSPPLDSQDLPSARQIECWQKMTPIEKLNLFEQLMKSVRAIKKAGVRMSHPEWTDAQIDEETARLFLHARG